VLKISGFW